MEIKKEEKTLYIPIHDKNSTRPVWIGKYLALNHRSKRIVNILIQPKSNVDSSKTFEFFQWDNEILTTWMVTLLGKILLLI